MDGRLIMRQPIKCKERGREMIRQEEREALMGGGKEVDSNDQNDPKNLNQGMINMNRAQRTCAAAVS